MTDPTSLSSGVNGRETADSNKDFFRFYYQVPINDPAQLAEHLFLQHETLEKLSFPDGIDKMFGVEPSVS